MTPTKAGEGKTTTLVGLTQGLGHIGKQPVACLREPSLGPVFGIKGGAAGGGMTQVVPMEDLNLHFTGDIHAIGAANNLLAAMLDASILHGNPHKIDQLRVGWRRALDMNDRALRNIAIGLGGRANGYPRESGFDITAASEVMAILAVSQATCRTCARGSAGSPSRSSFDGGKPITAEDLGAAGAMAVLLKDAIKPNLIQTLEGQPCLMHCGPFANIAHGNNSLVADQVGMKIADYVVTESGFGSDMGMEKFFDIVCRFGGLTPSAVVLVTTVRAIKHHGGVEDDPRVDRSQALRAIEVGMANVRRHLGIIAEFGMPAVVAVNRRPGDTNEEVELVKRLALEAGAFGAEANEGFARGGAGAADLANAVVEACEQPNTFKPLYDDDEPIQDKIEAVAKRVYGASRRLLLSRGGEEADAVHRRRARPLPGLHGQDAPLALLRPDAAQRARALHAAGARHPRLHRRRLARAAVRRHHADAGPRQDARRAQRRHRRRGTDGRAVLARWDDGRRWTPPRSAPHWSTTPRWRCGRGWRPARTGRATGCRPSSSSPAMLGVSRGTLRTALDRLEEAGEITRRQGSRHLRRPGGAPDRVPRGPRGAAARTPSWPSGAASRSRVRDLEVAERRLGAEAGGGVRARRPTTPAWTITRTILADGEPVAVMRDVVRPGRRAAAASKRCARAIEGGQHGARRAARAGRRRSPSRSRTCGRGCVSGRERVGRALGVAGRRPRCSSSRRSCTSASGEAVQHSSDTFAPGGIDLQVRRNLEVAAPAPLVRAVARD